MIHFEKVSDRYSGTGQGKDFLYNRKGARFRALSAPEKSDEYTVGLEFFDGEPSFISVFVNGKQSNAAAGYTCCNTKRTRKAVFLYTPDGDLPDEINIDVYGLPDIKSVYMKEGRDEAAICAAKADRARPCEAVSPLNLKRPLQLVISVGADSPEYTPENLEAALERMREELPYVKSMGFGGFESYVKWNFVEYERGVYDWSYYDAVIDLASQFGIKWFPLIIGGSAYALPEWFREDVEGFTGFLCLEHAIENNVPTIFNERQTPYIVNYLHAFGRHYEGNKNVYGVRLGPTGNYGESQYPASGNWGYKGQTEHMHIGWWAGDGDAHIRFSKWLSEKYKTPQRLSQAWKEEISSFDGIKTFLPYQTRVIRKRKDFVDWYMYEMTDWCNRWAHWMRDEFKSHDIYQSAGGWGLCECGTDFTEQTAGMAAVKGGIRATNEDESYELNFAITRMLSSAARFYGVKFGSEPAGYGTARSIINRLYNIIVNNGEHLFYYNGNFHCCDESEALWNKYAPLLDERAKPVIDVAVIYPDTMSKITDSSVRWLDGSSFFSQVFPLRRKLDYDFCSERMITDGALEKNAYKALVFLMRNHDGDYIEEEALNRIDAYVQAGGTVVYPILRSNARQGPATVEGGQKIFEKWRAGDTGRGRVIFINAMREPLDAFIDDAADALSQLLDLSPLTRDMLLAKKPRGVYMSALSGNKLALYNDLMTDAAIELADGTKIKMEPVSIKIVQR